MQQATAVTAGSVVKQPADCRQSRRTFEQEVTWQCEGQGSCPMSFSYSTTLSSQDFAKMSHSRLRSYDLMALYKFVYLVHPASKVGYTFCWCFIFNYIFSDFTHQFLINHLSLSVISTTTNRSLRNLQG